MKAQNEQFNLHTLLSAAQRGSAVAARQITERFQNDLLGIAYLLTGDRSAAFDLAGSAIEQALSRIRSFDLEEDFYPWLLRHIPLALLTADHRQAATPGTGMVTGAPQAARYQVDDDRSRMRGALELLTPRERLRLILSDYAGLSDADAEAIALLLPGEDAAVRPPPEVRRRVRTMASLDDSQSLANALRMLAVEAPRASLWEDIQVEVEAGISRQRFRSRLSSVAAVGVALLLLGGAGLFLLTGALGEDGPSSSGVALNSTPTVTPLPPTREPAPTATPAPYIPVGDVPDRLIFEWSLSGSPWGLADPSSGADGVELPAGDLEGISPDGKTLLLIDQEWHPDRVEMTLVAASSETGEERWRADVRPLAEGGPESVYFDLVVIDDLVYVASHDSEYLENVLTIAVIRLDDGSLRDIWGLNVGVEFSGPGLEVDLYGTIQPEAPVLTVHIQSREHGWHKVHRIDLVRGVTLLDSDPVPGFGDPPGQRLLTPDGRALVVIPPSGLHSAAAISYLIFDTMTEGRIELPFARVDEIDGVVVEYALSHDGRRLFALDIYNRQVAIIDLERRQIERIVDLQGGQSGPHRSPQVRPWVIAEDRIGNATALSPDGRYLYALSPGVSLPDGPVSPNPGIWKIDTRSWTLEAEWPMAGPTAIRSIFVDGNGDYLYLYRQPSLEESSTAADETLILRTGDGEIITTPFTLQLPVLTSVAEFYRQQYGRSPSIEGVVPQLVTREPSSALRVDVEVDPQVGSTGTLVDVRVYLLDPEMGTPLQRPPDAEPGVVIATFSNGSERRVAILGPSSDAGYRGQVTLDLPGAWDLTVTGGDPDTGGWMVTRPAVVLIADTVLGPDGRIYTLQASTQPDPTAAGAYVNLMLYFLALDGVEMASLDAVPVDAFPPSLELALPDGTSTTLLRSADESYYGFVRLPTPGTLAPTITFAGPDGQPVTLSVPVDVQASS